jgi:quinol monooxygenase YgiN
MIHVVATIELADGQRNAFLEHFHRLVPLVHEEQGCIEYGPTIDQATEIGAQGPARDNVVTVMEKWESLEALEAHLVAPHMVEYRGHVQELVKQTTIQVLSPVDPPNHA